MTKRVCGYSSLSYDERLRLLHLPTLSCRRQYFDLVEIYKIIHLYSFTTLKCKFFNRSSRGHSFRIWQDRFKRNTRKSALFIRAARHWNMLLSSIVDAKTLSSFKYKLRQHLNVWNSSNVACIRVFVKILFDWGTVLPYVKIFLCTPQAKKYVVLKCLQ